MAETLLQSPPPLTAVRRIGEGDGGSMEIPPGALVVLVGPQGCGKSTFARRWFRDTEVVSSDECRRLVSDDAANQEVSREAFTVFYALLRARLTHGRTTVADATHLTPWSRQKLRQIAAARGRPLVAIAFDVPLETCLARQSLRERQVPLDVVQRSHQALLHSLADLPHEGFDRIYVVHPDLGPPPSAGVASPST